MNFLNHYLIDILHAINRVANVIFYFLLFLLPIGYAYYFCDGNEIPIKKQENLLRILKYSTTIFILSILIIVFMPSKESLLVLLGVN